MLRRVVNLATWTIFACVLSHVAFGQSSTAEVAKSAAGLDLAGNKVDPVAATKGKPVVLIFMRTDCPVSNRYTPTIRALSQKYEGKAQFYLVYPDPSETAKNIEGHLRQYNLQLTPLRDPKHELVKVSEVEITPEAAVFNGQGQLIYHGRIDNWYEDFGRARPVPTTHELDEAIGATLTGSAAPTSVNGVGCYISDLR